MKTEKKVDPKQKNKHICSMCLEPINQVFLTWVSVVDFYNMSYSTPVCNTCLESADEFFQHYKSYKIDEPLQIKRVYKKKEIKKV